MTGLQEAKLVEKSRIVAVWWVSLSDEEMLEFRNEGWTYWDAKLALESDDAFVLTPSARVAVRHTAQPLG